MKVVNCALVGSYEMNSRVVKTVDEMLATSSQMR